MLLKCSDSSTLVPDKTAVIFLTVSLLVAVAEKVEAPEKIMATNKERRTYYS